MKDNIKINYDFSYLHHRRYFVNLIVSLIMILNFKLFISLHKGLYNKMRKEKWNNLQREK